MKIQRVTTVKDVVAAEALFDEAVRPEWATRFLGETGHHLLLAYVAEKPVGMITGVEMTHPDKGTEMFLYELGVAEDHQRRGIGTALVKALAELARERGCHGMWVATERTNPAAIATYRAAQASTEDDDVVVLTWNFPGLT